MNKITVVGALAYWKAKVLDMEELCEQSDCSEFRIALQYARDKVFQHEAERGIGRSLE